MGMRCRVALCTAAVMVALSGCGGHADAPAQAASASVTPAVLGACPYPGTQVPCAGYDPDAAMRSNEAYRQRGELPERYRAAVEAHRERITVVLQAAVNGGPLTPESVTALLTSAGYPETTGYGRSDVGGGLAVGVGTDAGCVYGGVRGRTVELEAGAGVADGGCLPSVGH